MTLLDYGILTLMAKKWKPVVVNKYGRESEFKVLDPAGILKNVSFLLSDGTPYSCTLYGPSSRVITPIKFYTFTILYLYYTFIGVCYII